MSTARPVTVSQVDGVHVIHLHGELHPPELAAFGLELDSALGRGDRAVVVDLREVTLVASAVVNAIFQACRRLRLAGGAIAIVCTDPRALRVIQVMGLAQAVTVCDTVDDATVAVSPHRDGFR